MKTNFRDTNLDAPYLSFIECISDIDKKQLYEIFIEALEEGNSYIYDLPFNYDDFLNYFFTNKSKVIICKKDSLIIGGYYIKPNYKDKGSHIANAGYVIKKDCRGQKIGFHLGKHSIDFAKTLGYKAIIFNYVFAKNTAAIKLWLKLGFQIIGTIPQGVKSTNNEFQDAKIMHLIL